MARPKSPEIQLATIQLELRKAEADLSEIKLADTKSRNLTQIICSFFKYAFYIYGLYSFRVIAVAMAGKSTNADIRVVAIADVFTIEWKELVAYSFAAICLIYAFMEKRWRKLDIKRLSEDNKELQQIIDSNRTSSQITPMGETNPKDKD